MPKSVSLAGDEVNTTSQTMMVVRCALRSPSLIQWCEVRRVADAVDRLEDRAGS